ncbi:MAG: c-type cytochrome biogenesis protein CcmI [Alphaproteobacteria bacterium]|nr:c-type cytochrome biogenesis protein CcmI [Alphaproteobacteria bacterium]
MVVWIVAALMTLGVVTVLLRSLFRQHETATGGANHDLEVYRAQLRELELDAARGLIPADEFASARREIARRLLAADEAARRAEPPAAGQARWRRAATVTIVVLVPVGAALVYGLRGSPEAPGFGGLAEMAARAPASAAAPQLTEAVVRLEARLRNERADPEGWALLGRSYMITGQPDRAVDSFRRAIDLVPDNTQLQAFYGESLVMTADGVVTPAAQEAFAKAVAADPENPAARFYLALADAQAGRLRESFDAWLRLAEATPADAPWRPMLIEQLERAARELKVDLRTVLPVPPSRLATVSPRRGPSEDDVRDAQSMAPDDRARMIRGMVDGLAERLQQNPNDIEGWTRLARSYRVLGETSKADEAEARVADLRAGRPLTPANTPAAGAVDGDAAGLPAGPGQSAMIESMVAGLAQRLGSNPNDRDGWLRLARSYQVLGRSEDSLKALGRAAELWPDDASVLQPYARATLAASGTEAPLPVRVFNLYRRLLELQPANDEALYYVGLGEAQRGNGEEAERLWRRALAASDPASEGYRRVDSRLRELRQSGRR